METSAFFAALYYEKLAIQNKPTRNLIINKLHTAPGLCIEF